MQTVNIHCILTINYYIIAWIIMRCRNLNPQNFTMANVYSCCKDDIVLSRSTIKPPPSTVSTVRASRFGVKASKSCTRHDMEKKEHGTKTDFNI